MENLKWALKLYSLTLVLPITFTLIAIFVIILGIETQVSFLEMLKGAWVDFYFTGSFLDTDATQMVFLYAKTYEIPFINQFYMQ